MTQIDHRHLVMQGYRVLRRTDRSPEIPIRLVAYDETVESCDVTHPDGVRAPTAFFRSPNAVARFTKMGWVEVTSIWTDPTPTKRTTARKSATAKRAAPARRAVRRKATA